MNTAYVCMILKCGEMSEQARENACVHARVYVWYEKEKLVAFRYLTNIGQILTSQVYLFCRATKSASFYLFINCFRVLASGNGVVRGTV